MVTVKPTVLRVGGQSFVRTSTMKIVTVYRPQSVNTTLTSHDIDGGADYQVPSGKVFLALEYTFKQGTQSANDSGVIQRSTTADTINGTIGMMLSQAPFSDSNAWQTLNINLPFLANEFVTIRHQSNPVTDCVIRGIEMDA